MSVDIPFRPAALSDAERDKVLTVLDYWHKIEFFIPFDVDKNVIDEVGEEAWKAVWVDLMEADAASPSNFWADLLTRVPPDQEVSKFNLYFGIFDKSDASDLLLDVLKRTRDLSQEETERGEFEGTTCFAKVSFQKIGVPDLQSVAVSTLPWALGRLEAPGGPFSSLGADAFADAEADLQKRLWNFQGSTGNPETGYSVNQLLQLSHLFENWAGFMPREAKALVEIVSRKRDEDRLKPAPVRSGPPEPQDDNVGKDEDGADEVIEPLFEITILNSFYIRDLERAARQVKTGSVPQSLKAYVCGLGEAPIGVDTPEGRQAIYEALRPRHLNRGRWPDEPANAMSLMQQFSISAARIHMTQSGLFSVNGPPGTGKTTLLRDLVADNIVRRARLLADLKSPDEAFGGTETLMVDFGPTVKPSRIRPLRPDIAAFGMVVASTNNVAVENVSTELPKREGLGKAWRREATYLQPIAFKYDSQTAKGNFRPLEAEEMPWGLISVALGNSRNRTRFTDRFYWWPDRYKDSPREFRQDLNGDPMTIWDWIAGPHVLSFADASREFAALDRQVEDLIGRLDRLATETVATRWTDEEAILRPVRDALATAERALDQANARLGAAEDRKAYLARRLEALKEQERLLERATPIQGAEAHEARRTSNAAEQADVHWEHYTLDEDAMPDLRRAAEVAASKVRRTEEELRDRRAILQEAIASFFDLESELGNPAIPASLEELADPAFQRDGLWHHADLAALRSKLFLAALRLHEAWLAEVAKKGAGFAANIVAVGKLLSGGRPRDEAHLPLIWQSLFMIVPVISSTFASFANQFRGLTGGSIDWLFIDEAGQAVPQAAVGALWRARRALVVGDPLQIEPVFSVPQALISALSDSPVTANGDYAPDKVSVQHLADQANPFIAYSVTAGNGAPITIGSPLRVHRRCAEPMFRLSNAIAYENKMILGLSSGVPVELPPFPPTSAWIDIAGAAVGRHEVQEQIDFAVAVLRRIYGNGGQGPSICVLSPFKAVVKALKSKLKEDIDRHSDWLVALARSDVRAIKKRRADLWKKLGRCIGTVHTFQGKQADAVLFVLGADEAHAGAVRWASSRPNLLNVALTRAKHRFFIVGEHRLWSRMTYFSAVAADADMPIFGAESFFTALKG